MQQFLLFIIYLTFLFSCSESKRYLKENGIPENFNCTNGIMKSAWYEQGIEVAIPTIKNISTKFLIFVDTNYKATNFTSAYEEFLRKQSQELDTSYLSILYSENWEQLTDKEKIEKLKEQKISYKQQAVTEHHNNNQGQNQIWIINNSLDTVTIQMQDESYICILQGLTKGGQWYPIQYWRFSTCGNSYYDKYFPPGTANSFITVIPQKGDYETKLRFKLLGKNEFYYSNEFTGKISYCDFVEDSTNYTQSSWPKPHYKLDSMIHLSMF